MRWLSGPSDQPKIPGDELIYLVCDLLLSPEISINLIGLLI